MLSKFRRASKYLGRLLALVLLALPAWVHADDTLIELLKPALVTQSVAIIKVDLRRLNISALCDRLCTSSTEILATERARLKLLAETFQGGLNDLQSAGAEDLNVIFKLGPFIPSNRVIVLRCTDVPAANRVAKRLTELQGLFGLNPKIQIRDSLVVIQTSEYGESHWSTQIAEPPVWLKLHTETELAQLSAAITAGNNAPIQIVFALTPDQQKVLEECSPETYGDGPNGAPTGIGNLRWISLALDPELKRLNFTIQTETHESATAIREIVKNAIRQVSAIESLQQNLPPFSKWLNAVEPQQADSQIVFDFADADFDQALDAIASPILQSRRSQHYSKSISKLGKIAKAMWAYEEQHGHLPPAFSVAADGQRLHSWRVLLLPHLGYQELFDRFNLNEPWNSEHNRNVSSEIPNEYRDLELGLRTRMLAPTGKNTAISETGVKLIEIVRGTVATILLIEAPDALAVHWTEPSDFLADGKDLVSQLIPANSAGFWMATADTGCHFVPSGTMEILLRSALQINDKRMISITDDSIIDGFDPMRSVQHPSMSYDPQKELPDFWFWEYVPKMVITGGWAK